MARRLNSEEAEVFSDEMDEARLFAYLDEFRRRMPEKKEDASDAKRLLQPWLKGSLPEPFGS